MSSEQLNNHGFFESPTWNDINSACHDASPYVGAAAGETFAYGAGIATGGNPAAMGATGGVIGDFVTSNWGNVCDLPANIAEAFSSRGAIFDPPIEGVGNSYEGACSISNGGFAGGDFSAD